MSEAAANAAADLHRQGALLRQRAHYADAERTLLRALELEHDFAAVHFELGLTYRDQGKFEDAADYLQLAAHFAPEFAAASFELGETLVKLERVDAAKTAYRDALAHDGPFDAAAGFGNHETYRQARKVVEEGTPTLIQAMDEGRVSISAASDGSGATRTSWRACSSAFSARIFFMAVSCAMRSGSTAGGSSTMAHDTLRRCPPTC